MDDKEKSLAIILQYNFSDDRLKYIIKNQVDVVFCNHHNYANNRNVTL